MANSIVLPIRGATTAFIPPARTYFSSKSLLFDGVDEYVGVGDFSALFAKANAWSISCWFKTTGDGSDNALWGNRTGLQGIEFEVRDPQNQFELQVRANGLTERMRIRGGTGLLDNAWHHAVTTYTGSTGAASEFTIYLDGVSLTPTVVNDTIGASDFAQSSGMSIGARRVGLEWFGNIDEVSFHNIALSLAQVQAIYNSGNPTDLTGSPGIVNWWKMGEDVTAFPTIPDQIGAADGTATNMEATDIVEDAP